MTRPNQTGLFGRCKSGEEMDIPPPALGYDRLPANGLFWQSLWVSGLKCKEGIHTEYLALPIFYKKGKKL